MIAVLLPITSRALAGAHMDSTECEARRFKWLTLCHIRLWWATGCLVL